MIASAVTPGLVVDFSSLDWWQWLFAAMGVLGVSAAPWILGLARGKIQFTATAQASYDQRAADLVKSNDALLGMQADHFARLAAEKDARIVELRESREGWKVVALKERELRETATETTIAASTAAITDVKHVLESLDESLDGSQGTR